MATTGSNLGLKWGWGQGFNGWTADNDKNLRLLDVGASHFAVIDLISTALPGSPADGDAYACSDVHPTYPSKLVRYNAAATAWEVFTPKNGWTASLSNPSSPRTQGQLIVFASSMWQTTISAEYLNVRSGLTVTGNANVASGGNLLLSGVQRISSGGAFSGTALNLSNGTANAILKFNGSLDVVASGIIDDGTAARISRRVTATGSIYTGFYSTSAPVSSIIGNWNSAGYWGFGSTGVAGDFTVRLQGVDDESTGAFARNVHLQVTGNGSFGGKLTAALSGPIYKSAQDKVNSGAVNASILPGVCTLPAALLEQDKILRMEFTGTGSGGASGPGFAVKLGSSTIFDTAYMSSAPTNWRVNFRIGVVSAGTSGTVRVTAWMDHDGSTQVTFPSSLITVNTTVSQVLDVVLTGISGQTITTKTSIIEAL